MSNVPLLTPPITPPPEQASQEQNNPVKDLQSISSRLDNLLALYLDHLDKYTKLRSQLSQSFASGFLSLAHANRTSTTGRRYGEEGYDQRMKALRRVKIKTKSIEDLHAIGHESKDSSVIDNIVDTVNGQILEESRASNKDQPFKTSKPQYEFTITTSPAQTSDSTSNRKSKSPTDPLKWYGILTPQSLRQSQQDFTHVTADIVPKLLNTINIMNGLEVEIQELRDQISFLEDEDQEEKVEDLNKRERQQLQQKGPKKMELESSLQDQVQSKKTTDTAVLRKPADMFDNSVSGSSSSNRTQVLVSRPAEPRSRVLKLD